LKYSIIIASIVGTEILSVNAGMTTKLITMTAVLDFVQTNGQWYLSVEPEVGGEGTKPVHIPITHAVKEELEKQDWEKEVDEQAIEELRLSHPTVSSKDAGIGF
jgi:hypothetical protein